MATEKVGIYRKYHGPIPTDNSGGPLAKKEWPKKRAHRWVVRWFGSDGKRYGKSFKTRKEATDYAEEKQPDVKNGKGDPAPKISLSDYYREHAELMKGNLAASTLHLHLTTVGLLAESMSWARSLDKITIRDIEKFRAKRLETGISASSANKEIKVLRRIFNLAITRGYLSKDSNPCQDIPMIRVAPKRPRYVRPDDFESMFNQAPDTLWRSLLVTLYTTGVRLREAMHLLWRDVDFESSQLYVTRRSADGLVQAWSPKDHEMRTIPLPQQAISLLATWQSVAPEGCPYVFMEHARWEYYSQQVRSGLWQTGRDLVNNLLRRYKTICRRGGVGPFTLHDLRRSCITNWAKQLPIHVVQQLAGHSDIKTTQRFYLSVQPDDIATARQLQSVIVGGILKLDLTDPKLTHSGQKRVFPGKQARQPKKEPPARQGVI